MDPKIEWADDRDYEVMHKMLQEHNRAFYPGLEEISYCIRDDAGKIIAGIGADRVGDVVSVECLVVDAAHRGKGYGAALLRHLEQAARERGCKRIVLRTYNFQAPRFYPKLGYRLTDTAELGIAGVVDHYFAKELE
ncbi:MAG TPA: GNAT family N-acetyltransferase [Bellilinea sp.]|nr:GNAT family N-acetyltransferase [Bellilinea sp.]